MSHHESSNLDSSSIDWKGIRPTADEIETILKDHEDWVDSGREGSPPHDLSGCDLAMRDLSNAVLVQANLSKADLCNANLSGANLTRANLKYADLVLTNFKDAKMIRAQLSGSQASLANFQVANLTLGELDGAFLIETNFKNANLYQADLSNAWLIRSDLRGSNLTEGKLEKTNVMRVKFNRKIKFRWIQVDSCHGSPKFKRFAQDQDYIEELKESSFWGYILYLIWFILADCGRTVWFWLMWSISFSLFFGWIFFNLGRDAFIIQEGLPYSIGTMMYYSVVTFTTLGFGDITPKGPPATYWVMLEVVIGYVMLGGLISILANKLARRT